MDHYLDIAAAVLKATRRPLKPSAILKAAYRAGLVPEHLHGKTQHKTLQARISEDIVARRENSAFFRTGPGYFFLRDFLTDSRIPQEHRQEFPTRRRVRELQRGPALAFDRNELLRLTDADGHIRVEQIRHLLQSERYQYDDPKNKNRQSVFLWSFVSVYKDDAVLSYRLGRYRDNRDPFVLKRSIGFSTLVHIDDRTLFNMGDYGIIDSGIHATCMDLDIPEVHLGFQAHLKYFYWLSYEGNESDLLAVIDFECPSWFEPVTRRLAMNDLRWLDLSVIPNDIEDFDPWSRSVIEKRVR